MKKPNRKATWPQVPTKAYDIRNRQDIAALGDALNQSPLKIMVDDLDQFLNLAEPWLDRDILRAHLLADGDPPPGTHYILAFVREREGLISPSRWTVMPSAMLGTRPVLGLLVGTPGPVYDMALTEKYSGLVIGVWAEWIRLFLNGAVKIDREETLGTSAEDDEAYLPAMVEWIRENLDDLKRNRGLK